MRRIELLSSLAPSTLQKLCKGLTWKTEEENERRKGGEEKEEKKKRRRRRKEKEEEGQCRRSQIGEKGAREEENQSGGIEGKEGGKGEGDEEAV